MHYAQGERFVLGHSIHELLKRLRLAKSEIGDLLDIAGVLDQFYIPARYPNGLPDGVPFEVYTEKQAREAVSGAERVVGFVRRMLRDRKHTT